MFVIIGDLGYDVHLCEYGDRVFLGGSGFHAAVGTIAAGKRCPIIIGCVGSDFDLTMLSKFGIKTDYIIQKSNEMSTRYNISYKNNVRNVIFEMGASKFECTNSIDDNVISSNLIHLTATRPEKQMKYIERLRNKGFSGLVSVDVFDQFCRDSRSQVLDVLEKCDVIFTSESEKEILGISPKQYCQKGKMFVLKKAENGAECYYHDQVFRGHSLPQSKVIDTTGAGDIMAGAFLSLLDLGETIQQALILSVTLATKSVQFLGSEAFLSSLL